MSNLDINTIRKRLVNDIDKIYFNRKPMQVLLYPVYWTILVYLVYVINISESFYVLLIASIMIGLIYVPLGYLGHDVMHGTVVKSKKLQNFLAYFSFFSFLISPHLWDIWHNRLHHGYTNSSRDPDAFNDLKLYNEMPIVRTGVLTVPGKKNYFMGILFFTYWFTFHVQHILWFNKQYKDWDFESFGYSQKKALFETSLYILFWISIGYLFGLYKSIFIIVIPMVVHNIIFLLMSVTEHVYLPKSIINNPLDNTVSVKMPILIEKFILNFNHHIEHHIFPNMNCSNLPKIKQWLDKNAKEDCMRPPLYQAVLLVFKTPRLYLDDNIQAHPKDIEGTKRDARKTRAELRKY